MNRRQFTSRIGLLTATGIAGCLGTASDKSQPATIAAATGEPLPEIPLSPTVSIQRAKATNDAPAQLIILWENTADAQVTARSRQSLASASVTSQNERATLLTETFSDDDIVTFNGCWRITGTLRGSGSVGSIVLDPTETYRSEPALYAETGCLTADRYQFTTEFIVEPEQGQQQHVAWTITLDMATKSTQTPL